MILKGLEPGCSVAQDGRRLRCVLEKNADVTLLNSHVGQFTVGVHTADVRIEPDDTLRVRVKGGRSSSPAAALQLNDLLPGNLRLAAASSHLELLADTRVDGELHLAQSLAEIKQGLSLALGRRFRRNRTVEEPAVRQEFVAEAINGCGWDAEDVVHLDPGWEIRRPVGGWMCTVGISIDGGGVKLEQVVLSDCGSENTSSVVALQALRFNRRLRHARLAITRDVLVAQARLHAGLVQPPWIRAAVTAVAVAARHAQVVLRILAEQEEVARLYSSVFSTSIC